LGINGVKNRCLSTGIVYDWSSSTIDRYIMGQEKEIKPPAYLKSTTLLDLDTLTLSSKTVEGHLAGVKTTAQLDVSDVYKHLFSRRPEPSESKSTKVNILTGDDTWDQLEERGYDKSQIAALRSSLRNGLNGFLNIFNNFQKSFN